MKINKKDIVLIISILVFATILWLNLMIFEKPGQTLIITIDGETIAELSLSDNNVIPISSKYGSNTVIIKNGRACVIEADCKDKICVQKGWISSIGESIICLPHKLVIAINGKGSKFDAISW